jgi:hypothetical protein
VFEHFFDPIGALLEWNRVVKPGGYIYMIVPKRDALESDRDRPLTTLDEFIVRHSQLKPEQDDHRHWSVMTHVEGQQLANYMVAEMGMKWTIAAVEETDSKVGNGWTLVLRKEAA